jgi:hypothetical protein
LRSATKTIRLYVDFGISARMAVRLDGEVIGYWFAPLHRAAKFLLEAGLARQDDIIETWREGRGGPDYLLDRMSAADGILAKVTDYESIGVPPRLATPLPIHADAIRGPSSGGPYRTGARKSKISNPANVGDGQWRIDGPNGEFRIVTGGATEALLARKKWLAEI